MNIETIWEAFRTLEAQLREAKKDVPVARSEFAELRKDVNETMFRVDHIQRAVEEQYRAGLRTGLLTAAMFAGVTALTRRLLPR